MTEGTEVILMLLFLFVLGGVCLWIAGGKNR